MVEKGDLIETVLPLNSSLNGVIGRVIELGTSVRATMLTGELVGRTITVSVSEFELAPDEYVKFRRGELVEYNAIGSSWNNKARVVRDCFVEDTVVDLERLDTEKQFGLSVGYVRKLVHFAKGDIVQIPMWSEIARITSNYYNGGYNIVLLTDMRQPGGHCAVENLDWAPEEYVQYRRGDKVFFRGDEYDVVRDCYKDDDVITLNRGNGNIYPDVADLDGNRNSSKGAAVEKLEELHRELADAQATKNQAERDIEAVEDEIAKVRQYLQLGKELGL